MSSHFIVVTDLDGTLLDHHSYSWDAAAEALAMLKTRSIPLVLCSSKTAAEIAPLRQTLELGDPFIVENGSAVYITGPNNEIVKSVAFGMNRAEVLSLLSRAREESGAHYIGFSDMTVRDVMAATGLKESEAGNALQREFTEPLLWQDTEEVLERFVSRLKKLGLNAVQGGRFLSISSGGSKGKAVAWLKRYYDNILGRETQVIALGDSENDVDMLEAADHPVLVKSPVKPFPQVKNAKVIRTTKFGPKGWNDAVIKIIRT